MKKPVTSRGAEEILRPAPDENHATIELARPAEKLLPSYIEALKCGWSPNNMRPEASQEDLAAIGEDSAAFLNAQYDPEGKGEPIRLPDGTLVPRIPGYVSWIWDGEFCGVVNFRWMPGTEELPPHCLGHIGYSIVPAKRGRGYATRALALLIPRAREEGLAYVELTTNPANHPSRRVIESNGGVLIERFQEPAVYGGRESLRYRIYL